MASSFLDIIPASITLRAPSILVFGPSNMAGSLTVQGAENVTGVLTAEGSCNVAGLLSANGAMVCTGLAQINGACNVTGFLSAEGALGVFGGAVIAGITSINGATSITGITLITGFTTVIGDLYCVAGVINPSNNTAGHINAGSMTFWNPEGNIDDHCRITITGSSTLNVHSQSFCVDGDIKAGCTEVGDFNCSNGTFRGSHYYGENGNAIQLGRSLENDYCVTAVQGDLEVNAHSIFNAYLPTTTLTPTASNEFATVGYVTSVLPTSLLGLPNTWINTNTFNKAIQFLYYNVLLGYEAGLVVNSSSYYNVCVGPLAGKRITSGNTNVCISYDSGSHITTGFNNICIGNSAGILVTTGEYNSFVGTQTASIATTCKESICIGFRAGSNNSAYEITSQIGIAVYGYNETVAHYHSLADEGLIDTSSITTLNLYKRPSVINLGETTSTLHTGILAPDSLKTTVSLTTGSLAWTMPLRGSANKKVVIIIAATSTKATDTVITFPVAFTTAPDYFISASTVVTIATTTTTCTLGTIVSGAQQTIVLEGF